MKPVKLYVVAEIETPDWPPNPYLAEFLDSDEGKRVVAALETQFYDEPSLHEWLADKDAP